MRTLHAADVSMRKVRRQTTYKTQREAYQAQAYQHSTIRISINQQLLTMSLLPNNDLQIIPRKYITYQHFTQKRKRITRNEPCYCGSGKKYKHCCIDKVYKRPKELRRLIIWLRNKLRSLTN